jgi:hypothetical protein
LRELGCDDYQGNLVCPPIAAEHLEQKLNALARAAA